VRCAYEETPVRKTGVSHPSATLDQKRSAADPVCSDLKKTERTMATSWRAGIMMMDGTKKMRPSKRVDV
jgi:hypothetical protein